MKSNKLKFPSLHSRKKLKTQTTKNQISNHQIQSKQGLMLELIDELILLVTHLKYYDGPNCDLIKYKDLLVIIMGSDNNKIKIKIK